MAVLTKKQKQLALQVRAFMPETVAQLAAAMRADFDIAAYGKPERVATGKACQRIEQYFNLLEGRVT